MCLIGTGASLADNYYNDHHHGSLNIMYILIYVYFMLTLGRYNDAVPLWIVKI